MLAHIACLWPVNDICCFSMEPICQTQSIHFSENQTAMPDCLLARFYPVRVLASKTSPKRMQLSLILELASPSDWFQICGFPDNANLLISNFPYFQVSAFPVYVPASIWPCKGRLNRREGLFEIVALRSQFSDPKWNLSSWFSDSRANSDLWTVVLPSYLARNVTQFHLFGG